MKEGTASTLMLRLSDGSRVRRRFLRADPMGKVLDWADVQGVDLAAQRLSSTLPKVGETERMGGVFFGRKVRKIKDGASPHSRLDSMEILRYSIVVM